MNLFNIDSVKIARKDVLSSRAPDFETVDIIVSGEDCLFTLSCFEKDSKRIAINLDGILGDVEHQKYLFDKLSEDDSWWEELKSEFNGCVSPESFFDEHTLQEWAIDSGYVKPSDTEDGS